MKSLLEINQILDNQGKIIVVDPNIHFLLKTARKLISHTDPECSIEKCIDYFKKINFHVEYKNYFESIGLILSGGYVGPQILPNTMFFQKSLLKLNSYLNKILNKFRFGRYFLWRYLIIFKSKEKENK